MHVYKTADCIEAGENISVGKCRSGDDAPPHLHEFVELTYLLEGEATHYVNGKPITMTRGDLLFINFKQTHAFEAKGVQTYVNLLIEPRFISGELIDSENALDMFALALTDAPECDMSLPLAHFAKSEAREAERIIASMLWEFEGKKPAYKSALNGYLRVLLAMMFRRMGMDARNRGADSVAIIPDVLNVLEENPKPTLKELAARYFYNPAYFSRMFKKHCGMTISQYVNEKRMERATHLIEETDASMDDIWREAGFSGKKQFYKLYKERNGETPGARRRKSIPTARG